MNKKMERLALAGRLEVKLAEPGVETSEKSFSGYGAVFNNTDYASDIIAPGAFAKTLADHKAAGTSPAMFFNHDAYSMPIGKWVELEEDDYGLKAAGSFLDTAAGRDAYTAVKAGAVTGLSIGYFATDFVIENGVRTITEAKLVEISVVTFPCNTLARVSDVKSEQSDALSEDDFKAKLAELGVDEDDVKALAAKRYGAKEEEFFDDEEADEKSEEAPADEQKAEEGEDEASDADDESEAKYFATAMDAVSNLIRELKQENHGR